MSKSVKRFSVQNFKIVYVFVKIYRICFNERELIYHFNFNESFDHNLCRILSHFKIAFKQEMYHLYLENQVKFITQDIFNAANVKNLSLCMFPCLFVEYIMYKCEMCVFVL